MQRWRLGYRLAPSLLSALSTCAYADDISGLRPNLPSSVDAPHAWSGFYGGILGGYGTGQAHLSQLNITGGGSVTGAEGAVTPLPVPVASRQSSFNIHGALAAAEAGYAMQFGHVVVGAETDFSWSGIEGSYNPDLANPISRLSQKIDWIATFRGRAGYAFDKILVFGTGGFAVSSLTDTWSSFNGPGGPNITSHKRPTGWALGGGLEYAINEHVSLKTDYVYVSLKKESFAFTDNMGSPITATLLSRSSISTFRLGLNYKLF